MKSGGMKHTRRTVLSLLAAPAIKPASAFWYGTAGAPPYHADAVHFDGGTWLNNSALVATDNQFASGSFWFKIVAPQTDSQFFAVDPTGAYTSNGAIITTGALIQLSLTFSNADNSVFNNKVCPPAVSLVQDVWHHFVYSTDTSQSDVIAMYLDDVQVFDPANPNVPFTLSFNGLGFTAMGDTFTGDGFVGDVADYWFAPGVSLLNGSNGIDIANRRKFISASGKPVNPTSFPGSAILFSGDATGFASNQGTGGAFTLTGTLTNASTSPSD